MKKTGLLPLFGIFGLAGTVLAHEGHEHVATNPSQVQWGLQGAMELINAHPLFVHFPIALLLSAVAFYTVGILFRKDGLLGAAKWMLFGGTLGATAAVWTGLRAAGTVAHGGDTHQIMMVHQYLGITILALSIILSLWAIASKANMPKAPKIFFLVLLVLAAIITQQADLGGRLVFLHGVGVGQKTMIQKDTSDHHAAGKHEDSHDHENHQH